jgi:hypothetical protein
MRNLALEKTLCEAIKKHLVIRLKYGKDIYWRTFEPQAVYKSTVDHINVTGIQRQDKNKPLQSPKREPRNFELSKISAVEITDIEFNFDPTFDPRDERFAHGIICVIKSSKIG